MAASRKHVSNLCNLVLLAIHLASSSGFKLTQGLSQATRSDHAVGACINHAGRRRGTAHAFYVGAAADGGSRRLDALASARWDLSPGIRRVGDGGRDGSGEKDSDESRRGELHCGSWKALVMLVFSYALQCV